jgi:eukaryotic-like serine/threonine-protein kinase
VDVMTAGRVIGGRYQVDGLLGRGGTASVWRARDLRLDRPVAVKELTGPWLEEPTALQRFDREARTVARLAHPNIVAVHDVDIDGETPYLVMELIEGVTVTRMLSNGVLTVGQAVAIAAQTCDGLSAAHAAGVIHRDIKPANLMLTPAGVVKICDFGIARGLSHTGDTGLTGPQFVMGTTRYMAPEQVRGQHVDARADLYGLGCTLHTMLTGVPPFSGARADVLQQLLDEEAVALREHRVDVPPPLEALVAQLLAKAAADRPQDAAEVKARLADLMNHPATEATPVSLALPPSRGGPVPLLSGRFRGRALSVAPARAGGPTPSSRARARRTRQIGVAGVVLVAVGTWAFVATRPALDDTAVPNPASTALVDAATAGSGPSAMPSPAIAATPELVQTGQAVQSNVDVGPATPPSLLDPVAGLRLAIQEQVNTGNLNPDRASDLYKQVDLIAKAVSGGNPDEVAKNIKAMRDKLTALRTGGQLSASGYDTLVRDLDAIAAASA